MATLAWQRHVVHQAESGPAARGSQAARACLVLVACTTAPAAQDLAAPDLAGFAGPGSTGNSAAHSPDSWQQHRETVSPQQSETRGHIGGAAAPRQSRNLPTPCQCGAAAVGGAVPRRRNRATSHIPPVQCCGVAVRRRNHTISHTPASAVLRRCGAAG